MSAVVWFVVWWYGCRVTGTELCRFLEVSPPASVLWMFIWATLKAHQTVKHMLTACSLLHCGGLCDLYILLRTWQLGHDARHKHTHAQCVSKATEINEYMCRTWEHTTKEDSAKTLHRNTVNEQDVWNLPVSTWDKELGFTGRTTSTFGLIRHKHSWKGRKASDSATSLDTGSQYKTHGLKIILHSGYKIPWMVSFSSSTREWDWSK